MSRLPRPPENFLKGPYRRHHSRASAFVSRNSASISFRSPQSRPSDDSRTSKRHRPGVRVASNSVRWIAASDAADQDERSERRVSVRRRPPRALDALIAAGR